MSLDIAAVSDWRAQLWDAGYRPVPVFNYDATVASPGKQPLGKDWQIDARRDPPFCATSPAVQHALNTGVYVTDYDRLISISTMRRPASVVVRLPLRCLAPHRSERERDRRAR